MKAPSGTSEVVLGGTTFDLISVQNALRHGVRIRNRSLLKRIHKNTFVGNEAVTWLVERSNLGIRTREEAALLCREMMAHNPPLIKAINDSERFKDARVYYRFFQDEAANGSKLNDVTLGPKALHSDYKKWAFAPHTAHNSLVLDLSLAETLEEAFSGSDQEQQQNALQEVRRRVLHQMSPDCVEWDSVKSTSVNGVKARVWSRVRPRGDFTTAKTEYIIPKSPMAFFEEVRDFAQRQKWNPSSKISTDGTVVEALFTNTEHASKRSSDAGSAQGGSRNATGASDRAPSRAPESPNVGRVKFTTLQPPADWAKDPRVSLAKCPEDMSIANLNDPSLQETVAHLKQMMHIDTPEECSSCRLRFKGPNDIFDCPVCGSVCCSLCCRKRVFEVYQQTQIRVCMHCYHESSRIRHPVNYDTSMMMRVGGTGSGGRSTSRDGEELCQWMSMTDIKAALEAEAMQEIEREKSQSSPPMIPDEDPGSVRSSVRAKAFDRTNRDDEDDDDDDDVDMMGDDDEVPPPPPPTESMEAAQATLNVQGGSGGDPKEANALVASSSSSNSGSGSGGGGGGGGGSTVATTTGTEAALPQKWATCKFCGARVGRTMEAIEAHDLVCVAQNAGNTQQTGTHLGGVPRLPADESLHTSDTYELKNANTRIVFHTRCGEFFRARQICAFQDSFVTESGLAVVYEMSVRHRAVVSEANHVTAEVLLLAYGAKPIKAVPDAAKLITISQVDDRSRSKWLTGLFSGDERIGFGGFNLLSEFRSGEKFTAMRYKDLASLDIEDSSEDASADSDPNAFKVSLEDFELMSVLGRGGFGKVMQVRYKKTGTVYAMKIFKKTELRRRRQVERTRTERDIMSKIRHPFIVGLSFAFQNQNKLYMVMDFVQGGDFFTFMRKCGRVRESWSRLYISEIAMALQYLHEFDIVYRDLKPENVLMDHQGHVKLTDFGLSRFFETRPALDEDLNMFDNSDEVKQQHNLVTRSYCGTEQYMAPEMLLQKGHNRVVDWWCLGLLMHEMITGRHPFQSGSHYDTLRAMVTNEPIIDPRVSPAARALIRRLLIKDPTRRLGAKRGAWIELRPHPFFNDLDWDKVYQRQVPAPYIPNLKSVEDTNHFEDMFTREAPVDSVVEPERKTGGLFGGLFSSGRQASSKAQPQADKDFEGFSYADEGVM